jgi:hypothetical protein
MPLKSILYPNTVPISISSANIDSVALAAELESKPDAPSCSSHDIHTRSHHNNNNLPVNSESMLISVIKSNSSSSPDSKTLHPQQKFPCGLSKWNEEAFDDEANFTKLEIVAASTTCNFHKGKGINNNDELPTNMAETPCFEQIFSTETTTTTLGKISNAQGRADTILDFNPSAVLGTVEQDFNLFSAGVDAIDKVEQDAGHLSGPVNPMFHIIAAGLVSFYFKDFLYLLKFYSLILIQMIPWRGR